MADGRPYTSDYCMRHPHLEANFKGNKKDLITGTLTGEYRKHMERVKLDVIKREENGVMIKRAICPKCGMSIQIK